MSLFWVTRHDKRQHRIRRSRRCSGRHSPITPNLNGVLIPIAQTGEELSVTRLATQRSTFVRRFFRYCTRFYSILLLLAAYASAIACQSVSK